jgi:hypothetical protein
MSRLTVVTRGNATAIPLNELLAIIPSLPRPFLTRLVTRMIDRLNDLDGDPDLELTGEDDEDDEREQEQGDV